MTCPECGRVLAQYDTFRMACKGGHIWTRPEFADVPVHPLDGKPGQPAPVRLVKAPAFPAWLPGAMLGGLAVLIEVLEVVL